MPECKYCNIELEYDTTNYQEGDADEIICYERGHCPKCNKKYRWIDIYKFSHYDDLEEN